MNHKELEKILKNKATCVHLHIIKALLNLKPLYLKKDSRSLYIFTTQELVLYFLPESFPLESCRDQQHSPPPPIWTRNCHMKLIKSCIWDTGQISINGFII